MNKHGRFVIQRHERQGETVHWDLMLEKNGVLETYRVNAPPEEWGNKPVEAVKIFDHPLRFLTYEGSVNKGKGEVTIAEAGIYEEMNKTEDERQLRLEGKVLKGDFSLRQIDGERWELKNIEL
jgi:bifunctional non-homologous end joining protein LigD